MSLLIAFALLNKYFFFVYQNLRKCKFCLDSFFSLHYSTFFSGFASSSSTMLSICPQFTPLSTATIGQQWIDSQRYYPNHLLRLDSYAWEAAKIPGVKLPPNCNTSFTGGAWALAKKEKKMCYDLIWASKNANISLLFVDALADAVVVVVVVYRKNPHQSVSVVCAMELVGIIFATSYTPYRTYPIRSFYSQH